MHAEMRRMPVERARHAKRLGHANVRSGPNIPILAASSNGSGTPTSVQQTATSATPTSTSTTSTSAHQSSSSAVPPSSTQSSLATASHSSSTSSVAVTTDTQLPTPIASTSIIIQPTTSVPTLPTSSSPSTPQANSATATSTGLSGGALAGIIAGSVIVGVAIIVFFIRKTYLRRREHKRISWSGVGAGFSDEPKLPDLTEQPGSFTSVANASQRTAPMSPFERHGSTYNTPVSPATRMHPTAMPTYGVTYGAPTPPPATFNNPAPAVAYPTQPSSTYGPQTGNAPAFAVPRGAGSVHGRAQPLEAMVKCAFVPNLPDELSVMTGERIFVAEQYDDGWALCANGRGERGMVPRECLDLANPDQADMGWNNMRRMSSLNPDGKRY